MASEALNPGILLRAHDFTIVAVDFGATQVPQPQLSELALSGNRHC